MNLFPGFRTFFLVFGFQSIHYSKWRKNPIFAQEIISAIVFLAQLLFNDSSVREFALSVAVPGGLNISKDIHAQ